MVDWKRLRFLVVDDETMIRSIVVRLLQNLGCKDVDQAKNYEDAVPHLMGDKAVPDCVILDIAMAPTNGIELAFEIRSHPWSTRHDVPIIMLTGHSDQPLVDAAKLLDVAGFILKPASRATLATRIDRAFRAPPVVGTKESYLAKRPVLQPHFSRR